MAFEQHQLVIESVVHTVPRTFIMYGECTCGQLFSAIDHDSDTARRILHAKLKRHRAAKL